MNIDHLAEMFSRSPVFSMCGHPNEASNLFKLDGPSEAHPKSLRKRFDPNDINRHYARLLGAAKAERLTVLLLHSRTLSTGPASRYPSGDTITAMTSNGVVENQNTMYWVSSQHSASSFMSRFRFPVW